MRETARIRQPREQCDGETQSQRGGALPESDVSFLHIPLFFAHGETFLITAVLWASWLLRAWASIVARN